MCYNTKLTKKVIEIELRFKAIFEDMELYIMSLMKLMLFHILKHQ